MQRSALILLILFIQGCTTKATVPMSNSEIGNVLIIAKPSNVQFIEDYSGPVDGDLYIGSLYRVELHNIEVIRGEFEPPSKLEVELMASHGSAIEAGGPIYTVLSVSAEGNISTLYWGHPALIACIPQELKVSSRLNLVFGTYIRKDGQKCSPAEIYR